MSKDLNRKYKFERLLKLVVLVVFVNVLEDENVYKLFS